MSLTELLPAVRTLPRADKLRLMHFLVIAMAHEEGVPFLATDDEYPIWTPLQAFDAAETLLRVLETHKAEA